MKRIFSVMICILFIFTVSSGCASNQNHVNASDGFDIYCYSPEKDALTTEKYDVSNDDVLKLVYILLNRMYSPEEDGNISVFSFLAPEDAQSGEKTTLPDTSEMPAVDAEEELPQMLSTKGNINDVSYSGKIVTISFGDQYDYMDNVSEVLLRTAVVKTLCQIAQVNYVTFYVNGHPLMTDGGSVVGLMSGASFISDTGDNMDTLLRAGVKLYFADDSGQNLVCETLQMAYDKTKTIEQAVVERLIRGPVDRSLKRTIPSGTKLLGISVKDGVAYINFDSAFLEKTADVSPDVTIYSIVNSLCEISTVKQVQILVDGAQDGTFRDKYQLSSTYEMNNDIVTNDTNN